VAPRRGKAPAMPLQFGSSEASRTLSVAGELDLATADELAARLEKEGRGEGDLTLDLAELSFVDSTGIRALIRAADGMAGRGRLILRDPSPAVRRVLELMGLSHSSAGLVVEDAGEPAQSGSEARSFPADRTVLQEIRTFVRSRAVSDSFGRWADNLALAVSEACANAILHSGTPEITVTWKPLPDRVEVEVRDEGIFRRALPSEQEGPAGRGILLMMSAMDQITITCGTDSRPGTVVRMVKLRNGGPHDREGKTRGTETSAA
jgi:anti-anti-sigma factor